MPNFHVKMVAEPKRDTKQTMMMMRIEDLPWWVEEMAVVMWWLPWRCAEEKKRRRGKSERKSYLFEMWGDGRWVLKLRGKGQTPRC